MIEVKNVSKKYGNHLAVDDISFEIKDNEIVGFLGANGAGKSTTMNMITGFIDTTKGSIIINGYDISKQPNKAKAQIGYMPEGTPLYLTMSVKEFVTYMAELKGVKRKERKEEVAKVLKETGLEVVQEKLIKHVSRGYKQRVSLAGALVGNPKVLILDEPTVGLDPKQVHDIRNLIKDLGKKHSIIFCSHTLSEVSQICNRVIIINKGKIVAVDTPSNLEKHVQVENSIVVSVEDLDNKMAKIKIKGAKEIKLISDDKKGNKQYRIIAEDGKDIRKEVLKELTDKDINIMELKNVEATLEDAFLTIVDNKNAELAKAEKEEIQRKEKREKELERMSRKNRKEAIKEDKKKAREEFDKKIDEELKKEKEEKEKTKTKREAEKKKTAKKKVTSKKTSNSKSKTTKKGGNK